MRSVVRRTGERGCIACKDVRGGEAYNKIIRAGKSADVWRTRWESNPNLRLRRPPFYPLYYECKGGDPYCFVSPHQAGEIASVVCGCLSYYILTAFCAVVKGLRERHVKYSRT